MTEALADAAYHAPYSLVALATTLWFAAIYTVIAGGAYWLAVAREPLAAPEPSARVARMRNGQVREELLLSVLSILIFAAQSVGMVWLLRADIQHISFDRPVRWEGAGEGQSTIKAASGFTGRRPSGSRFRWHRSSRPVGRAGRSQRFAPQNRRFIVSCHDSESEIVWIGRFGLLWQRGVFYHAPVETVPSSPRTRIFPASGLRSSASVRLASVFACFTFRKSTKIVFAMSGMSCRKAIRSW